MYLYFAFLLTDNMWIPLILFFYSSAGTPCCNEHLCLCFCVSGEMFTVSACHLQACDPLWVNFCIYCKVDVQLHSLLDEHPDVPAPFTEDCFFPITLFWHHGWELTDHKCKRSFLDYQFYPIGLYLSLCHYCALYFLLLCNKISNHCGCFCCFDSSGSLMFLMNYRTNLSVSTKATAVLMGTTLTVDYLGKYCHCSNAKSSSPATQGVFSFISLPLDNLYSLQSWN